VVSQIKMPRDMKKAAMGIYNCVLNVVWWVHVKIFCNYGLRKGSFWIYCPLLEIWW